jgi:hypothetical protein
MNTQNLSKSPEISLRLAQVLRIYCAGLDTTALADLRAAIEAGQHPWFRQEFTEAIRLDAFTPTAWHTTVSTPDVMTAKAEERHRIVRQQQHLIWRELYKDEAFPLHTDGG